MRGPALRHIYAASDLHTDHAANMEWVRALASGGRHRNDVLICAGDVSDKLQILEQTMALLSDAFGAVFFAPGNHEFWVGREDASDSLAKLAAVQRVLEAYGVLTTPQRVALASGRAVAIAPLLSFHHASFDTEPDVVGLDLPTERCLVDYRRCAWPPPLATGALELAQYIDGLNESAPSRSAAQSAEHGALSPISSWAELCDDARTDASPPLLTFSHFLPRIELCPEKRYLRYPPLMRAVGSHPLRERVAGLRPHVHVFGHTHFGWDAPLDGTRYVQAALGTPREREARGHTLAIGQMPHRPRELEAPPRATASPRAAARDADGTGADGLEAAPMWLHDGDGFRAPTAPHWSEHYRTHQRRPEIVTPAPWIVRRYLATTPRRVRLDELPAHPS